MGQLGVHFAIDTATAERLLAATDDGELSALVEEIEEEMLHVDSCGTDKAWDAIHRCLTDGQLGYTNGTSMVKAGLELSLIPPGVVVSELPEPGGHVRP